MSLLPGALAVPASLREIGAVEQSLDEPGNLVRVGRPIRVDHGDDVAGRHLETAGKRVSLAAARLHHDADVGPQFARHRDRVVGGVAVDDDQLVYVRRNSREHVRQVLSECLINGWAGPGGGP